MYRQLMHDAKPTLDCNEHLWEHGAFAEALILRKTGPEEEDKDKDEDYVVPGNLSLSNLHSSKSPTHRAVSVRTE